LYLDYEKVGIENEGKGLKRSKKLAPSEESFSTTSKRGGTPDDEATLLGSTRRHFPFAWKVAALNRGKKGCGLLICCLLWAGGGSYVALFFADGQ